MRNNLNKISIVGTNGVGKTVFVTVWAKSLEKKERGQPFIVPTPQTYAYIERNWLQRLKNGLWPESTPQSEFIELKWTLSSPGGAKSEISVCDLAGHDIRRLYAGDEPKISDESSKTIYDSIESANIILLIVNLKDFITADDSLRIENTTNLLSMLKHFFSKKKTVALLFSQWHEYEAWVNGKGGLDKVLETYLPSVQNACSLHGENVNYFMISAVVQTVRSVDDHGNTTILPAPNFSSSGFLKLNQWLTGNEETYKSLNHMYVRSMAAILSITFGAVYTSHLMVLHGERPKIEFWYIQMCIGTTAGLQLIDLAFRKLIDKNGLFEHNKTISIIFLTMMLFGIVFGGLIIEWVGGDLIFGFCIGGVIGGVIASVISEHFTISK